MMQKLTHNPDLWARGERSDIEICEDKYIFN